MYELRCGKNFGSGSAESMCGCRWIWVENYQEVESSGLSSLEKNHEKVESFGKSNIEGIREGYWRVSAVKKLEREEKSFNGSEKKLR